MIAPTLRAAPPEPLLEVTEDGIVPTLEQMERAHIERALRRTSGHREQAATMLGISERNLYRKLHQYGFEQ